jgi:hypothetical protein
MNTSHGNFAYTKEYGPVRIQGVYAGGLRLVRTLLLPDQQKVLPIETHKMYPHTISEYLVEREECTPREATKLVAFWTKNPAKIPTDLMSFYKEQLK